MSSKTERIASIDIFRGLTMLVMIFVNDLAEVHGLPWWTYHAHANQDLMTYVDMVFPFFLFIVGMSMPLAVTRRLERNPSLPALWWHIFSRSAGLVVLGLILANAEKGDAARMGVNRDLFPAAIRRRRVSIGSSDSPAWPCSSWPSPSSGDPLPEGTRRGSTRRIRRFSV
jgi:hypothetical protein